MDNEVSVLLFLDKRRIKFHCSRVKGAESGAEFAGRYLCAIEDRIRKELGLERMAPIPAGIRWMQWRNAGHTFGRFTICGSPEVVETVITGTENTLIPITSERTRSIPLPSHVRPCEIETVADAVRVMGALPIVP